MKTFFFENQLEYPIVFLLPSHTIKPDTITRFYSELYPDLKKKSIFIGFPVFDTNSGLSKTEFYKNILNDLEKTIKALKARVIYTVNIDLIKLLLKARKADNLYGLMQQAVYPGYENLHVLLGIGSEDFTKIYSWEEKLHQSYRNLEKYFQENNSPKSLNELTIQTLYNPDKVENFNFNSYLNSSVVTCDIETFSLKHPTAGIATIAFTSDFNSTAALSIDLTVGKVPEKRKALKDFFEKYKGKLVFHNATFDVKILAYTLCPEDPLQFLKDNFSNIHCTQIMAYLCTNNTIGNELSLKKQAQERYGIWEVDNIQDVTQIPLDNLLLYNGMDTKATRYLWDKYLPLLKTENQWDLYNNLFKPAIHAIIRTELNGFPINIEKLYRAKQYLTTEKEKQEYILYTHPLILEFDKQLQQQACDKHNAKLKTKVVPLEKFSDVKFNYNSGPQLIQLLHEVWGLPVIDRTPKKKPATSADALRKILKYANPEQAEIINAILELDQITIILNNFIEAFYEGEFRNGMIYLLGSFNLTGTVSGRLSSAKPNMQNLPSKGNKYAKLIKQCFEAPPGFILVGADFDSLEDKISALTTKDPNKLKVYEEAYDGHCLRAYSYFGDQMPDIDPDDVNSINSIAKKYPKLRQDSKAPTFALTYQGTATTLVNNCGFSISQARDIERSYHELYRVSDEWVANKLQEASRKGYVEGAFGLRLRTPLIASTDLNKSYTPTQAQAEARTAGNMLGQSYCMLNTRALVEFLDRVDTAGYSKDVLPVCLIHDALYFLVKDDLEILKWVHKNLLECMAWQELPEIQHDKVKISATMSIFYPSWNDDNEIKNNLEEVYKKCTQKP